LGLTQPVGTDDSRLENATIGAGAGALPIAAYKGVVGAKRMAQDYLPTNTALNQLSERLGGNVPTKAPSIGMTHQQRGLPADFVGAPTPKYGNVQGISPTVAMLSDDPNILKLEMNARNRSPELFMGKDANNIEAVYRGLDKYALNDATANRLQDTLNSKTGPVRELAFEAANRSDPSQMIGSLSDYLAASLEKPGIRNSDAIPLLNKANRQISPVDVQAEDLYTLRKELADKLNSKNLVNDELTNSAKNNRRLTTELIGNIDTSLSGASGGLWDDYLSQHAAGMAPIEEGRAFQNVLDKFEKNKPLLGKDIPTITPHGLRTAVDNETYKNMGKQGWVSKVSGQGRSAIDDSVNVMNDLEKAKTGAKASDGSQTSARATNDTAIVVPADASNDQPAGIFAPPVIVPAPVVVPPPPDSISDCAAVRILKPSPYGAEAGEPPPSKLSGAAATNGYFLNVDVNRSILAWVII